MGLVLHPGPADRVERRLRRELRQVEAAVEQLHDEGVVEEGGAGRADAADAAGRRLMGGVLLAAAAAALVVGGRGGGGARALGRGVPRAGGAVGGKGGRLAIRIASTHPFRPSSLDDLLERRVQPVREVGDALQQQVRRGHLGDAIHHDRGGERAGEPVAGLAGELIWRGGRKKLRL